METFGQAVRRLRGELALREVARLAHLDPGHLSRVERGKRPPNADLARALDQALGTGGELAQIVAEAQSRRWDLDQSRPWQTVELLQRMRAGAVTPGTAESIQAAAFELCCEYPVREAATLRRKAHGWLGEVTRLLHQPVGLATHKELLTAAGWLTLLTACLEYDMGMRVGAEATRLGALELGREGGNPEIVGWAYEMAAWFALTQSRYRDVLDAAETGQAAAPNGSAAVQLAGQRQRRTPGSGTPEPFATSSNGAGSAWPTCRTRAARITTSWLTQTSGTSTRWTPTASPATTSARHTMRKRCSNSAPDPMGNARPCEWPRPG